MSGAAQPATQPKVMKITRETEWTRAYATTGGVFVDSKYRTYECDVPAEEFARRWLAADRAQRAEMEVAFQFYPQDDAAGIDAALAMIAETDPAVATRLRKLLAAGIEPPAWHLDLLTTIGEYCRTHAVPDVTVASNRWFTVRRNLAGLAVTVNPGAPVPTAEDIESLLPDASSNRAYRDAIRWVLRFPSLVNGTWLPRTAPRGSGA